MKFRWKLLMMMLAVSILAIVILRTFGIHNVQTMADALSDEVQSIREAAARNDIHGILFTVAYCTFPCPTSCRGMQGILSFSRGCRRPPHGGMEFA